jgi:hypothetical protein
MRNVTMTAPGAGRIGGDPLAEDLTVAAYDESHDAQFAGIGGFARICCDVVM